ncbi:hypothetical protein ACB098_12G095600 [Castanea mollissima]
MQINIVTLDAKIKTTKLHAVVILVVLKFIAMVWLIFQNQLDIEGHSSTNHGSTLCDMINQTYGELVARGHRDLKSCVILHRYGINTGSQKQQDIVGHGCQKSWLNPE